MGTGSANGGPGAARIPYARLAGLAAIVLAATGVLALAIVDPEPGDEAQERALAADVALFADYVEALRRGGRPV